MAGGGCTLPGKAMVLMPGAGYEGVTDLFLTDDNLRTECMSSASCRCRCRNICRDSSLNSKKALMRPIGSHNDNANAAKMEKLLEDGINAIGLGPQGMGGK